MQVQLITPERTFFSGSAQQVNIPGTLGDFGVLPGHEPFISTIRPGVISIENEGSVLRVAVLSGIAEVTPEHCSILAETAIDCAGITQADAQAKLQEAQAKLAAADSDAGRKEAEQRVAMAEAILLAL